MIDHKSPNFIAIFKIVHIIFHSGFSWSFVSFWQLFYSIQSRIFLSQNWLDDFTWILEFRLNRSFVEICLFRSLLLFFVYTVNSLLYFSLINRTTWILSVFYLKRIENWRWDSVGDQGKTFEVESSLFLIFRRI